MAVAGFIIVVIYAVISLSAPLLPIHSYKFQILDHRFLPPSIKSAGKILLERERARLLTQAKNAGRDTLLPDELEKLETYEQKLRSDTTIKDGKPIRTFGRIYLLGTDSLGRDLLARIIYGGQVSIAIGLIGSITSILIGTCIGAIAGYMGGKTDYLITRFIDIMYSLPYMMLVIILMALFGRGILNLFFALAFVSWLTVARVVRGQIISLKNSEFIEAARSIGAGNLRIVFKHLVPNTLGIIVVFTTLTIPNFIMMEAFLSFLGLGVQAPFATWGSLIQESVDGMDLFPWRLFFPAITMVLFLFAMNFFGDGLRDALDPQLKNKL
ncbi:MAG: ABC transporter permease [Spirochaetales bacterium]|nr:ABC transporter permease [Spirochaetales bacterium]